MEVRYILFCACFKVKPFLNRLFFIGNKVKINQIFSDYQNVSLYLQKTYGFSKNDTQAIGESFIYYSPQVGGIRLFYFEKLKALKF